MNGISLLPDFTQIANYTSSEIAAFVFVVCAFALVRAFFHQRWSMFFSSLIFGIACWIIVANPGEFGVIAKAAANTVLHGGLQ